MTLIQIGQFLQQILSQLAQLLNPIAAIQARLALTAVEHGPYEISNRVASILTTADSTKADTTAIIALISALQTSVNLLGSPQQSTSPVVLPVIPPAGYGGLDGPATSSAVWGAIMPFSGNPAGQDLGYVRSAIFTHYNYGADADPYSSVFSIQAENQELGGPYFNTDTPQPDPANILPTDTLVTWLTRELPTWTVDTTLNGPATITVYTSGNPLLFFVRWTPGDFEAAKAAITPPTASQGAPIWPGLGSVTLGTPVALDVVVDVPGPLKAVIVEVTGVPSHFGQFDFGTEVSYRHVGAIAFSDDNGDVEETQFLGFVHSLFVPKTMVEATAAHIRCTPGVAGTATPVEW